VEPFPYLLYVRLRRDSILTCIFTSSVACCFFTYVRLHNPSVPLTSAEFSPPAAISFIVDTQRLTYHSSL
jgi:hypothetical protein